MFLVTKDTVYHAEIDPDLGGYPEVVVEIDVDEDAYSVRRTGKFAKSKPKEYAFCSITEIGARFGDRFTKQLGGSPSAAEKPSATFSPARQ